MSDRERQMPGSVLVERTTRPPSSERARPDGKYAVPARSLDVCLANDGPFIDVENTSGRRRYELAPLDNLDETGAHWRSSRRSR